MRHRSASTPRGLGRALNAAMAFALVATLLAAPTWPARVSAQEIDPSSAASAPADANPSGQDADQDAPTTADQDNGQSATVGVDDQRLGAVSTADGQSLGAVSTDATADANVQPPVSCGSIAVGSIVLLLDTPSQFVCASDGRLYWVSDDRALQQHQTQGAFVDATSQELQPVRLSRCKTALAAT